jgi:mono/diheme cytochrome c family protein
MHVQLRQAARAATCLLSVTTLAWFLSAACQRACADEWSEKATAVLERRCVSCHDAAGKKGGLSLVTREELLAGGESGPIVEPGKPAASLLLDFVTGDKPLMPKSGPPLSVEEIAALRAWIAEGAKWPAARKLEDKGLADTNWWSLQPLVRPAVPRIQNPKSQIQNPIDGFVVAKLTELGLPQSPEADRRTLIRRLYFDLVGLSPTPAEVEAFVSDRDSQAYQRLVDRLLASPHYGERWARHWLDVVHFGETHGYDKDKPRPNAWPYRDYVIRSLNSDKPYGRFVAEQIAGDAIYPGTVDGIEALGFIAAGPWDFIGHAELPETKIDGKVARHLDRDDMVQNTTGTFLSLTVGCAQCHNHKFDPVTQREYYQLQAVFAALDRNDKPYDRDPAVAARRGELTAELARLNSERTRIEKLVSERGGEALAALDRRLVDLTKAAAATGQERPEFGYHSAIETRQDAVKWVQVDLGQPQRIARIEYVACHDDFNNIGPGFGFPVRYKVEACDDAEFRERVQLLVDRTESDVPNPGVGPQAIDSLDVTARYVRVTATKLAPRLPTDFMFALAEISVLNASGENLAAEKPVTSLDSIEAPVRWQRANLVDGYFFGRASGAAAKIAQVQQEREELVDRVLDEKTRLERNDIAAAVAKVESKLKALPAQQAIYAGTTFRGSGNFAGTGGMPRPIHLLARGSVTQPGEAVEPGALACLPLPFGEGVDLTSDGNRRAALARWISDPQNPLAWRSIANRVWQYHLGRGIVDSPNDFGRMGSLPSHPELLDWLAVELRDGGQSLKHLHKLIVMSHTYRQASAGPTPQPQATDPSSIDADNRYLWRANRRRLEAEALRDAVLAVAGKLDRTMGGPSFQDFVIEHPEHSPHYQYHLHDFDDPKSHRRSVYRFIVRSQPQPFMATLDCADPSQRVDKRNESLSALQALATLNNGFMVTMSRHWAERLSSDTADPDRQVALAFRQALGRDPSVDEQAALADFTRQHGLANACRLVLNLNEFTFVD